ncbi:Hypothetical predicted protein, partial [Paramuricea clavata]
MKKLLTKCNGNWSEFRQRLLEWRNVPRSDGFSPSQMLFGRRQRSQLPAIPACHAPIDLLEGAAAKRNAAEKGKTNADKTTRKLKQLHVNDEVWIQDHKTGKWRERGTITSIRKDGHSYVIVLPNGWRSIRNRRFLRLYRDRPRANNEEERARQIETEPSGSLQLKRTNVARPEKVSA